jgi:putative Mg2+ transporter-C (MgtC) family protein
LAAVIASAAFVGTAYALATAFGLGAVVGLERQWRQRTAGLRTNVLVCVGAAAFADLGARIAGPGGSTRVVSYIVSGIGFLGAGVIMKEGAQVRGLNTAATLWASAAVGAFAGVGLEREAALVTVFVLAGNTLLRPVVNFVNRRPMKPHETEALYRVHLVCKPKDVSAARDLLFEELESRNYPLQDIETLSKGDDLVELAASLTSSEADPQALDRVVLRLEQRSVVVSATWTVSATG